jgi:hypothetical protein
MSVEADKAVVAASAARRKARSKDVMASVNLGPHIKAILWQDRASQR